MRANTVLSALMRCIEWCDHDMPKANTRGNYKSTCDQMIKIAESAEYIVQVVRQRLHDMGTDSESNTTKSKSGKINFSLSADNADDLLATLARIKTLNLESTDSSMADLKPDSVSIISKDDPDDSNSCESNVVAPNLSIDVKKKKSEVDAMQKKSEASRNRNHVDWKSLVEQYSVAINDLQKENFETSGADVCANYLKRWMDALKVGFKRKRDDGRIRYGADKISDAIPKFVLAITQYIQDNRLSEFEDDFKRWEQRALGLDSTASPDIMSHGLPYIISHMFDADNIKQYANNELANAVYREFLDGSLHSVSRVKHGADHYEYLSVTAVSVLKDKASAA